MAEMDKAQITQLLHNWNAGDEPSFEKLIELVYDDLYQRARFYLSKGKSDILLSCTMLVNEAYLELVVEQNRNWKNRNHFFAIAATVMRHLIIRFAEARYAQKRGGDAVVLVPDNLDSLEGFSRENLTVLNEALEALEKIDERKVRAIELSYILGLSQQEAADVLEVSLATFKRDLSFASAWLERYIKGAS